MPEYKIHVGDCLDVLKTLPDNSVDSIVTDPPYGLSKEPDMVEVLRHWLAGDDYQHKGGGFMGKSWDSFVPGPSVWKECLRVLKPGGHLLAFFGSRTQDIGTLAIRLAGFEIRDCAAWLYGSGFPKSRNIGNDVEAMAGWGTALKPAIEPITVARKPLAKGYTVAANVLVHGTGALNIDGCRVSVSEDDDIHAKNPNTKGGFGHAGASVYGDSAGAPAYDPKAGRWPANLIHDGSDEVVALFPANAGGGHWHSKRGNNSVYSGGTSGGDSTVRSDGSGSAARFFYSPKASRKDRNEGLEDPSPQFKRGTTLRQVENTETSGNTHPTVKPTDLMAYLCRLVTPPGGTVLDPFMGSGSTGKAAMREGFHFIGCELSEDYAAIARARIEHARQQVDPDPLPEPEPANDNEPAIGGQIAMF